MKEEILTDIEKQDFVVMHKNGCLAYKMELVSKSATAQEQHKNNQRTQLRRKKLVFGLDGYEQHSLAEVNQKLETERESYLSNIPFL